MPTTRLLELKMDPSLDALVEITTPATTKTRIESQTCYYVYGDPASARCTFSLRLELPVEIVDPLPEPGMGVLVAVGLMGLVGLARRRRPPNSISDL